MSDVKVIAESLSQLNIPFDKSFYNMPLSHYKNLAEKNDLTKVNKHLRNILMHNRHDDIIAEKARKLIRLLNKKLLKENVSSDTECECGFDTLGEEYDSCPCCNKKLIG